MNYDRRDGSLYAATNGTVFGALVQRSTDLGTSCEPRNQKLDYPEDSPHRVRKVWQVVPATDAQPSRLFAGAERAGLFSSDDHGQTWSGFDGLNRHPTGDNWQPGNGGLCLHTIIPDPLDPDRIYVGISAVGIFRSDDGGQTWAPKNKGVRADFLPEIFPEYGQCVHKAKIHPQKPGVIYQQNHCGVYRSDDRGENLSDISDGLPSRFGFPLALHAQDPDTVYVLPLEGDFNRVVPQGQMAVWRSRDRGATWTELRRGFPEDARLTVLREGMDSDACDPCGIYVGTQTGQVFFSRDEGDRWELLADYLPPIYSVSLASVA